MGCCGSGQGHGPLGPQMAAGMTQTVFSGQRSGPGRVRQAGASTVEHKKPPQLLYFKPQGLVTGLVGTIVLAGEGGGI